MRLLITTICFLFISVNCLAGAGGMGLLANVSAGGGGGNTITLSTSGTSSASGTGADSLVINRPSAATTDGRIMYAFITSDHDSSGVITAPAGWSVVGNQVSSSSSRHAMFYKVTSSEGATYTFTRGDFGAVGFAGVIATFQKDSGTWDAIQSTNESSDTGASTLTSGSVTTTNSSFLVIGFGSDDATTAGTVSGMTNAVHEEQASCATGLWYESITSGGADTRTWTPGSTGDLASVATVLEAE